jgi:eukaryotic-like serine/threonine-protein kinase
MSDAKSYKDEWEPIENLGAGGQATTIKANNKEKKTVAAVKILNRQKDMARRARMHREATALATLDHPNIPHFIDSNSHHFKDEDYNLFIACEYISGDTLSKIDLSKHDLKEKIAFIKKILETLNYCHKEGILHRDLKPDNIILRENNFVDPVLVDFGLSFNSQEQDDDNKTPSGEQLGNRFLLLPEQKVGEVAKRDDKSDISCAVGLFFYVLTGLNPIVPIDEQNRKPHQRENAKAVFEKIPDHEREKLNIIFDKGFEIYIERRWQTIQSLILQIIELEESTPMEINNEKDLINAILQKMSGDQYDDLKFLKQLYDQLNHQILSVLKQLSNDLGKEWSYSQSGGITSDRQAYRNLLAPHNSVTGYTAKTVIHGFITGSEFVVHVEEEKEKKEILRQPLIGEIDWASFRDALHMHYLETIHKANK